MISRLLNVDNSVTFQLMQYVYYVMWFGVMRILETEVFVDHSLKIDRESALV